MPILLGPELAFWCELLAVLGIGSSVAVALAACISRRARSAVWERAVWQACTLTLLALVTLEVTGLGAAAVHFCVARLSETLGDREIEDPAETRILEYHDGIATHTRLTPEVSTAVAPGRAWWPAIVWGIGSLAILGRLAWGRAILAVVWWRCAPLQDEAIRSRVHSIANRLGLRHSIRPLISTSLRSPAVFHWLFPVLALPGRFSDDYSAAQQEAVLAHELAHLARRDPAWQAAAMLACAVLWWQPLSWWSSRRLRAASEAAADEASLLLPDGPSQLAASLVSLAQRLTDPQFATVTSMQGNGLQSDLAHRVERLLSLEVGARVAPSKPRLALAHAALPVCFSVLCIFCTAWAPSRRSFAQGDTTVNVVTNAWRSSLAAAAMWTALGGGSPLPGETIQARPENAQSTKEVRPGEQDRIREVLGAIRQQVEQLQKEGKREAAEKLSQVAESLNRKFAGEIDAQSADRREALQKLNAARERAQKLAKEGNSEQAVKLMSEAEAMARDFKQRASRYQNVQQKLSRIHEQVDKLASEGKREQAEKLRQEAEEMARAFKNDVRSERDTQPEMVEQALKAKIRQLAERDRKEGNREAAQKAVQKEATIAGREIREQAGAERAERSEALQQKLRAAREQVERLHKQGEHGAAEKLMREAEALAHKTQHQGDAQRSDSSDDLRAGLRQLQRDFQELREQLRRLQEQRSSNRE